MSETPVSLKTENLSVRKDNRDILRKLRLEIKKGDRVSVVGPSGSGKSTLLHVLAGLEKPDDGRVLYDGIDLLEFDDEQTTAFRGRNIGFVFQRHHLMPQCTLLENLLLPVLAIQGETTGEDGEFARSLLSRLGLADRAEAFPGQISGGECQRVAVLRALVNRPSFVFADEPTGELDAENGKKVADLLEENAKRQRAALLVVTHDAELAKRMDKRYRLTNGQLEKLD